MCTLIISKNSNKHWPIMIASTRDEEISRSFLAPARHWKDYPQIFAGYDNKKRGSSFSKLSLFQRPEMKFNKNCPLSGKNAPVIDYKNIKLLKRYISESGRILPSRVTSVSLNKQKELARSIKKARLLALL